VRRFIRGAVFGKQGTDASKSGWVVVAPSSYAFCGKETWTTTTQNGVNQEHHNDGSRLNVGPCTQLSG